MTATKERRVVVCDTEYTFPSEVRELRDCNDIQDDVDALRARMDEDGYLMIRGFHDVAVVQAARERYLAHLADRERKAVPHNADIAATPEMMALIESPRLFDFWERYFGEPALTFEEKWVRDVRRGASTGIHYDYVYMGRGSQRLHTVWTPIGDASMELGALAICVGSHKSGFQRLQETYGQLDVDRTPVKTGGWFSRDPQEVVDIFGGQWCSTDFKAGDAVFFPMHTLHASTRNETDEVRLSCDIRFQPASHPADDRWYGEGRSGHHGRATADCPTMEELREQWGF